MAYSVHITEKALADTDQITEWIKARSPESASAWFDRLMDAILSLDTFPTRCPLISESAVLRREVRQQLIGQRPNIYRILFEISEETVYVLRVRHGAQSPRQPEDIADHETGEDI